MKKNISLALGLSLVLAAMAAVLLPGLVWAAESSATEAFTFVQLCDTQLGKGGYEHDVRSLKRAVRLINALKVDLVVICGDLVDNFDDTSVADFIDIMGDLTMPYYPAPGNHDVGDTPTVASLNRYREAMGEDYFSVEHKGYTFVMANTSLWRTQLQGESEKYDSWFKQTLADAHGRNSPVFVVQHHPTNTLPASNELLALFETSRVVAVLAGHTHRTTIEEYNGIQLVNGECTSTNSDGRPLGFRLWHVDSPASITHEFIPLTLRIPTVDFNGDEVVDAADMCILVDHWGENYASCDIAPPLFGDGVVDVQDLVALAEHLFEEILPVELATYWKLDETEGNVAYDSIWNKDGILNGGSLWQPSDGQRNGALAFEGIDGYLSTPSILDPAETGFSVIVWIKGGGPGQVVISQQDGANWLTTDAEGKLMTELKSIGRDSCSLQSQVVITDGQWHRIGLVWDGSNRTLCVDGVAVAEDTQSGLGASSGGLYIGTAKTLDTGTFFSGLIDDVRIYDVALTSEQIEALAY
ncbi:MAG: metallophosphoesterase [Phycisphaerales bacterium]|nr:MAG: metallophosphoesterase [Phycisphaerales bacterium]